jgi:isopentenyl-diphosphate delta-isomerase
MSAAGTESVVLLDESGAAIGTADKASVHGPHTPLHLAFSCYVFDAHGRLLVTQRALHKKTWGGVWTNSCCGHPAPGEDLTEAVRRRVGQELGLDLDDVRLALPTFRYRAVMPDGTVENEMCPVFVATTTDQERLDPSEVEDAEWAPWSEFRAQVLGGTRDVSPWCVEQVAALAEDPLAAPPADATLLPAGALTQPSR